ncbi:MAG: TolC family protein [bacterium]
MRRHARNPILLAAALLATLAGAGTARGQEPLDLETCIERALAQNPRVDRVERNVERSEIQTRQAAGALLPVLSFTGAFSRYTSVSPQRLLNPATQQIVEGSATALTSVTYYTGLSLSQPLYDRSVTSVYTQALAGEQSARAAAELERQQLVLQVHQAYYGLLRAERNLEVAAADVAYNEGLLELVRTLRELGSRSEVDLLRQENALAQARQRVISARNGAASARAELNYLMGEAPTGPLALVDDLEVTERTEEQGALLEEARQAHPAMLQSRLGVAAARAGVDAARASRYPSVNLSGSYSWRGDSYLEFGDAFDRDYTWSVGVNMRVPIFDGLRTRYSVDRADLELQGARRERQAARRDVDREVHRALLDLENATQSLAASRRSVRFAEETLRLAREQYRLGVGSLLEVNASQLDLVNARYQEVQALFSLKIAQASLEFATGSLHAASSGERP